MLLRRSLGHPSVWMGNVGSLDMLFNCAPIIITNNSVHEVTTPAVNPWNQMNSMTFRFIDGMLLVQFHPILAMNILWNLLSDWSFPKWTLPKLNHTLYHQRMLPLGTLNRAFPRETQDSSPKCPHWLQSISFYCWLLFRFVLSNFTGVSRNERKPKLCIKLKLPCDI